MPHAHAPDIDVAEPPDAEHGESKPPRPEGTSSGIAGARAGRGHPAAGCAAMVRYSARTASMKCGATSIPASRRWNLIAAPTFRRHSSARGQPSRSTGLGSADRVREAVEIRRIRRRRSGTIKQQRAGVVDPDPHGSDRGNIRCSCHTRPRQPDQRHRIWACPGARRSWCPWRVTTQIDEIWRDPRGTCLHRD